MPEYPANPIIAITTKLKIDLAVNLKIHTV
jgi:hypothetical protein